MGSEGAPAWLEFTCTTGWSARAWPPSGPAPALGALAAEMPKEAAEAAVGELPARCVGSPMPGLLPPLPPLPAGAVTGGKAGAACPAPSGRRLAAVGTTRVSLRSSPTVAAGAAGALERLKAAKSPGAEPKSGSRIGSKLLCSCRVWLLISISAIGLCRAWASSTVNSPEATASRKASCSSRRRRISRRVSRGCWPVRKASRSAERSASRRARRDIGRAAPF